MKYFLVIALVMLSGCIPENNIEHPQPCFEVIYPQGSALVTPIMLNKCTGESWILLKVSEPLKEDETSPSFSWAWYTINGYYSENYIGGK